MFELFNHEKKYVFGGYATDSKVRFESTSGGAFSTIADTWCDENYVIFGAEADGLNVFHSYVMDKSEIAKFRKSKYSQSTLGTAFSDCRRFLQEGKKVLFSGTPCQIAGLKMFLNRTHADTSLLLSVEVVCEGVPTPLYIEKYEDAVLRKYGSKIKALDYRYTGKSLFGNGKWDFEVMETTLKDTNQKITLDRWFNPFWSIWLNHLMSRPACYKCRFAQQERTADITLGDLWGVHLYCPELYGKNGGSSLLVANNAKGAAVIQKAQENMFGHELKFEDALKYQAPMRKHIASNPDRAHFMRDIQSDMTYEQINRKWAKRASFSLLWSKYIWGNRQKIALWNFTHRIQRK